MLGALAAGVFRRSIDFLSSKCLGTPGNLSFQEKQYVWEWTCPGWALPESVFCGCQKSSQFSGASAVPGVRAVTALRCSHADQLPAALVFPSRHAEQEKGRAGPVWLSRRRRRPGPFLGVRDGGRQGGCLTRRSKAWRGRESTFHTFEQLLGGNEVVFIPCGPEGQVEGGRGGLTHALEV